MAQSTIRVLFDPSLAGAANMARDEALLARVGLGESPASLRFYGWSPATISLGYFQPFASYESLPPPAGELDVVRRPTGGGAILHDQELTYAIVAPLSHAILSRGPRVLYELAHDALMAAVGEKAQLARCGFTDDSGAAKGPFFCFERRHCLDVLIGAEKLAGSAQRRTRDAVLQHGSIVLERRYEQQRAAELNAVAVVDRDELARRMVDALASSTGIAFELGVWSEAELADARALESKHRSDEWLRRC